MLRMMRSITSQQLGNDPNVTTTLSRLDDQKSLIRILYCL